MSSHPHDPDDLYEKDEQGAIVYEADGVTPKLKATPEPEPPQTP